MQNYGVGDFKRDWPCQCTMNVPGLVEGSGEPPLTWGNVVSAIGEYLFYSAASSIPGWSEYITEVARFGTIITNKPSPITYFINQE